jgi:hypothetical protein
MKIRILLALATVAVAAVPLLSCKESTSTSGAAASASAASSAEGDVLPAIEVTGPKPKYSLADLTDKQVGTLATRAGFTPTVVGKTPPGEDASTIRVAGFKNTEGQKLESVIFVRCRKDDKPPRIPAGEAYYRDGNCHMQVAVRLGIRNKSAESKQLLETLLATTLE